MPGTQESRPSPVGSTIGVSIRLVRRGDYRVTIAPGGMDGGDRDYDGRAVRLCVRRRREQPVAGAARTCSLISFAALIARFLRASLLIADQFSLKSAAALISSGAGIATLQACLAPPTDHLKIKSKLGCV